MKKKAAFLATAVAGLMANTPAEASNHAGSHGKVKCKGISTKYVNDCGAHDHSCSGKAKTNFDKEEWLYTSSKSVCNEIKGALKSKAVRAYIEQIQKGTVVATKRGKKI